MDWKPVGNVPPSDLASARMQLHYSALILASAAHSALPHADDDSHTNLAVVDGGLRTRLLDSGKGVSLELSIPSFSLILREGENEIDSLRLSGKTLQDGLRWVENSLRDKAGKSVDVALRAYQDFPISDLATGGVFAEPEAEELTELDHWFANGQAIFTALGKAEPGMSESRVWPHHFDLGALISLDEGQSIGVGLSPGDHHYDQPYFYSSPYPGPSADRKLPEIVVGRWHTDGFVSAVVTAEELLVCAAPSEAAMDYSPAAVAACRQLLG